MTAEGCPRDIRVLAPHPSGLFERAAVEPVKKFRYAPRFVEGKPVDGKSVRYLFTFIMPDEGVFHQFFRWESALLCALDEA